MTTTHTARLIDTGAAQTAERPWGVYAAKKGREWLDGSFATETEAQAAAAQRNAGAAAAAATSKTRTITLTDRPPVKIREDDWPVIARGSYSNHDNQYQFQANRKWKMDVRVRQHADGRAIAYGVYDYDTAFQGERGFLAKAGLVLDKDADLVEAIRAVGATIADAATEAGHDFGAHIAETVRSCIAELPAQEL